MSTEERTRLDDAGTDSSTDSKQRLTGREARNVLANADLEEIVGRELFAELSSSGDPCRDTPSPFCGTVVGRDDDGRVRLKDGGAIRCAKPSRLINPRLRPQAVTDGGTLEVPTEHVDQALLEDGPQQLTAGLQEGDIHVAITFPSATTPDDLDAALAEIQREAEYILELQRGDRP